MTIQDHRNGALEDEIAPLWKWATRAIGIIGTALAVLFAWVQFRTIPFPAVENIEPVYARRIVLAIYYLCWVAGTTLDTNVQKEVYRRDPQLGNVPREATLAVVGLFVVGALLLWASTSDERISIALIPFLFVNIVAWRVLLARVTPIMAATAAAYEDARLYHRLEQLEIIKTYLAGNWQWVRFALMAIIVLGMNLLCFDSAIRMSAARTIHNAIPNIPQEAISNLLPTILLIIFVIVAEFWIWILRSRNAVALKTISALATKYAFQPRSSIG